MIAIIEISVELYNISNYKLLRKQKLYTNVNHKIVHGVYSYNCHNFIGNLCDISYKFTNK